MKIKVLLMLGALSLSLLLTTSCEQTPLAPEGVYYYNLTNSVSESATIEPNQLEAPENVTATGSDGAIYVVWDNVPGAAGYQVFRICSDTTGVQGYIDVSGLGTFPAGVENLFVDVVSKQNPLSTNYTYTYKVVAKSTSAGASINGTQDPDVIFDSELSEASSPVSPTSVPAFGSAITTPTALTVTDSGTTRYISFNTTVLTTAYKVYYAPNTDPGTESYETWQSITVNTTGEKVATTTQALTMALSGTFKYVVIAEGGSTGFANSAATAEVTATYSPTLTQPANISAMVLDNDIRVTFDKVTGATTYELYRSADGQSNYAKLSYLADITDNGNTQAHFDDPSSNLTSGKTYYYKVVAKDSSATSPASVPVSVSYTKTLPAIANLGASGLANSIKLTWTKPAVATSLTYEIFRSESGTDGTFKKITTTAPVYSTFLTAPTNMLAYDSDSSLVVGITYYYTVRAKNSAGDMTPLPSAVSASTTGTLITTSSTVKASDFYKDRVRVSWTSVANAVSYEVYRSADGGGTFTKITSPVLTYSTTFFTGTGMIVNDATVTAGVTYKYRIIGVDKNGGTASIGEDDGIALTGAQGYSIATPGAATVTTTYGDRIIVSWAAVTGADSYALYRAKLDAAGNNLASPFERIATSGFYKANGGNVAYDDTTATADGTTQYIYLATAGMSVTDGTTTTTLESDTFQFWTDADADNAYDVGEAIAGAMNKGKALAAPSLYSGFTNNISVASVTVSNTNNNVGRLTFTFTNINNNDSADAVAVDSYEYFINPSTLNGTDMEYFGNQSPAPAAGATVTVDTGANLKNTSTSATKLYKVSVRATATVGGVLYVKEYKDLVGIEIDKVQ